MKSAAVDPLDALDEQTKYGELEGYREGVPPKCVLCVQPLILR